MSTSNRFHDLGPILVELGYEPIPVKAGGKAPVIDQWSSIAISPDLVKKWAGNGHANCSVGIRCGSGVGAIDVDVVDKDICQKLFLWISRNLWRDAPPIRIGQQPKFLVPCRLKDVGHKMISTSYQDQEGKTNRIEVLSNGQQYVAYGQHPSGSEYTWRGGGDLSQMRADELVLLDEFAIQSLFDEFNRLAKEAGWQEEKKATKAKKKADQADGEGDLFASLKLPSVTLEEIREALSRLPVSVCDDREDWIRVGMAIHFETRGSDEGYELFDEWSKQSGKYAGRKDTRLRWRSFSSDKSGDGLVTIGTIQNLAEDDDFFAGVEFLTPKIEDELYQSDSSNVADVADVAVIANVADVTCNKPATRLQHDFVATLLQPEARNEGASVAVWQIIADSPADFTTGMLYQELDARDSKKKSIIRAILSRFEKEGKIRKKPGVRGTYEVVTLDLEDSPPAFTEEDAIPFPMPMDLHKIIRILPGSVVVIGGATNAGKTLLGLSFLRNILTVAIPQIATPFSQSEIPTPSLRSFTVRGCPLIFTGIRFLNSEMSQGELGYTLKTMGQEECDALTKKVHWVRRTRDWQRAILRDGITIIDFLQIHKDFYEIGGIIAECADALGHGVLIILIQKKSGESSPRGGDFALERARLAINLDYAGPGVSSLQLRKVKHPMDYRDNPQGKELDFRFDEKLNPVIVEPLRRLTKKERENINQKRLEEERKKKSALDDFIKYREGPGTPLFE